MGKKVQGIILRDAPKEAQRARAARRAFARAPRLVATAPRAERDPGTRGTGGTGRCAGFATCPSLFLFANDLRADCRELEPKKKHFAPVPRFSVWHLSSRVSQRFSSQIFSIFAFGFAAQSDIQSDISYASNPKRRSNPLDYSRERPSRACRKVDFTRNLARRERQNATRRTSSARSELAGDSDGTGSGCVHSRGTHGTSRRTARRAHEPRRAALVRRQQLLHPAASSSTNSHHPQ